MANEYPVLDQVGYCLLNFFEWFGYARHASVMLCDRILHDMRT